MIKNEYCSDRTTEGLLLVYRSLRRRTVTKRTFLFLKRERGERNGASNDLSDRRDCVSLKKQAALRDPGALLIDINGKEVRLWKGLRGVRIGAGGYVLGNLKEVRTADFKMGLISSMTTGT